MLLIYTILIAVVLSANPWVDPFYPLLTYYVSPTATNGDGSLGSPFGFDQIGQGKAGNLYLTLGGTYSKGKEFFLLFIARNSSII